MAALAELVVALVGDTSEFDSSMQSAGASLQAVGSQMTSVGSSLTAGITLPLAGVGTAAIAMATQFNSGMANVASLSDDARARVEQWGPSVQQMAIDVGQSTGSLQDGLYQVVSAFGATDDSLAILDINARAAAAGLATTSEAIDLTSAVTRAYGDTSTTAVQQVADLAQQAVSMGQTTFPELAGAIGAVTPLTAALGVSQEELFAVMATGAGVTGSTSQVATQLRGVLQSLMAPTDAMAGLISDYGYESGQAMIEGMGLNGAIQAIVGSAESSGTPLQSYIGSIEGQTLALSLAGPQAETFAGNLTAMGDAAGASQEAFVAQTEGVNATGFAMEQAAVQVQVWGEQLGNALMPALQSVLTALQPVVDWITQLITGFTNLNPQTQMIIIGILGLVAALGPILMVLGSVVGGFGALMGIMGAILSPIGLIIAAVIALGVAWATNFGGIRDKTAEVWSAIQAIIAPVIAWIQTTIQTVVGAVVAWWNTNWPLIQTTIQTVWTAVQMYVQAAVAIVQGIIQTVIGAVIAWWNATWPSIQATIQTVWGAVQMYIQTAVGIVQGIIQTVIGGLIAWWNAAWPPIQEVVTKVWGAIVAAIQTAAAFIGPIVQQIMSAVAAAIQGAAPIIEQFKGLWESLGPLFQALVPVVQFVGQVIGVVLGILGAAFLALIGVVVGVVNGIAAALTPLIQTVMGVVQAVIGIFTGLIQFFTGMWNTIVGLFTGNSELVQQGMDQMSQGIQTIWTNLVNGVIGLVTGLVNTVVAFVQGFVTAIITFFTNLYQALVGGSIVPDMVNGIISWFNTLMATGTAIMQAIQAAIEAIWNAILSFMTALWTSLVSMVQGALAALEATINAVMNAIWSFLQSVWTAILGFLTSTWSAIISLVTSSMTTVQSIIQSIWTAVQSFWQSIWTAIQSFTQAIWTGILNLIQAALTAIQAAALGFMSMIQSAWAAFLGVIQGLWQGAWSLIASIFQSALGTLTAIAGAIVTAIFRAFDMDWGSIGRNIVDSIGNALRAGLSWVADQARRIAEAALEAARRALGIGSPSKEFMWLAEMSVAGFSAGMEDTRPIERAVVRGMNAGLGAGARAAGTGGPVDRSVRIGQVNLPGASGVSVLEQMRAYGR